MIRRRQYLNAFKLSQQLFSRRPVSVGYQLYLIGGFRYRLINASARISTDIDYLFEGNLAQKQLEIADVLRSKLLPRVKQQLGYEGDVRTAAGPEADSPAVRTVELAFYRTAGGRAAGLKSRLKSFVSSVSILR